MFGFLFLVGCDVCDVREMKHLSGVHMVVATIAPQNPITLAAKKAFWDLPRSEIIRFSKLKKVDISSGASLFQTLMEAVMGILKVDEVRAMKIVARRLPHDKNQLHFSDYLLGMDSGIELIVYHDKQQVQDEQKSVCYKLDGIEMFRF